MAETSVQISSKLVISSVHVPHNVSQEKDKNSSASSEKCKGAPSEMPVCYSQMKAQTCNREPPISVQNVMTNNMNPKVIRGAGYKLTSVENVSNNIEVFGSNAKTLQTVRASDTNMPKILCASQNTANNVTTMNNKGIGVVRMDMVKKSYNHDKNIQINIRSASGILWKKSRELIDLRILESHLDWFNSINRGSHCIEDTYENFQILVKVESALGIIFNNSAGSTMDGLKANMICKSWPNNVHDVTAESLYNLLSKSPLYKYDVEKAVWKKWFLENGTSIYTEDTHWNGILYLRKIFAKLMEPKDYSFLCLFLDTFHSMSCLEIVKSISEKSKVPACSKLQDMVVHILFALCHQGLVVSYKPTQPALLQDNNLQVNSLKPDLSSNKTVVTQKETLIDAAESSETTDIVHFEVSSLNCSKMQTPPHSVTRWNDTTTIKANHNAAVPMQVLSFAPPHVISNNTANDNKNASSIAIDDPSFGRRNPLSVTGNHLISVPYVRKRGRPKKATDNGGSLRKKMTIESTFPKKETTIESTSFKKEMTFKSTSPKKKNVSPRKKITPESLADEKYFVPLSLGWVREVVNRKVTLSTSCDIYYHPPVGKKLRSQVEVQRYLNENKIENLTMDNFTFFHSTLGCGAPYELIREANYGSYFGIKMQKKSKKKKIKKESNPNVEKIQENKKESNPNIEKKQKNKKESNPNVVNDVPEFSADELTEAIITNEVGETTGYEEFIKAEHNVLLSAHKSSENAASTADVVNLPFPNKQTYYNSSLANGSTADVVNLPFPNKQTSNNSSLASGSAADVVSLPFPNKQTFNNFSLASGSTADVVNLQFPNKQTSNNFSLASGSGQQRRLIVLLPNQIGTGIVAGAITSGVTKASSDNLKVVKKSDVDLDNKWLDIIEKYHRRKMVPLLEKEVKGDSNPIVSPTNRGNSFDKESSLNLSDGSVNPSKPSTSRTNQTVLSQIKVRNWSELSSNEAAPFPVIKPNLKSIRPDWTYCPD